MNLRDIVLSKLTDEQKREFHEKQQQLVLEREKRSQRRCSDCGASLCPYGTGHSFSCWRRGSGN